MLRESARDFLLSTLEWYVWKIWHFDVVATENIKDFSVWKSGAPACWKQFIEKDEIKKKIIIIGYNDIVFFFYWRNCSPVN